MASIQHDFDPLEFPLAQLHPGQRLSEDDFVAWCGEDTRAEWVDGEVIVMAAASWIHVRIAQFLGWLLEGYVSARKLGQVGGTEFCVRLNSKRRRLPDILFIANERLDNLRPNHLEGPPNLIVEVVSEDSVDRDRHDKYLEYEAAGVDEYWIVDPLQQRVDAYTLGVDKAYRVIEPAEGKISSVVVAGFYVRPEWLWRQPLPDVVGLLGELLE